MVLVGYWVRGHQTLKLRDNDVRGEMDMIVAIILGLVKS
jgi:hypothetical protein